ncbi:hypothetical protein [Neorhodopirellula lusitana]|uniref:hypothetical protein n=1 Tax=Neorhodopirellula lusitana TaxID=445327 RepID=UPI0038502CDD
MKTILWAITIVGLLPLVAFSLLHLFTYAAMRRAIPPEDGDPYTHTIVTTTFQFSESARPTVVATHAWPAIIALCGATLCIIGLLYLIPRQPLFSASNGYDRFQPLLTRIMASNAEHPSLIVSARDGNEALLVMRNENGWELSLSANSDNQTVIEQIKSYFAERDVDSMQDYTTHDDEFDITTTHLAFPLSGDPTVDAETCVNIFRDVIGVTNDEPMEFNVEP